jgi:hypothetical protein
VIPLLEQDFYVACFSYDGFDETEDTVFPGMLEETEKIENYIRENFDGRGRLCVWMLAWWLICGVIDPAEKHTYQPWDFRKLGLRPDAKTAGIYFLQNRCGDIL